MKTTVPRRLIGCAAVVGIGDTVAAATRVPDRMLVSRRSGECGRTGSVVARQMVGWHVDRIPPYQSVQWSRVPPVQRPSPTALCRWPRAAQAAIARDRVLPDVANTMACVQRDL